MLARCLKLIVNIVFVVTGSVFFNSCGRVHQINNSSEFYEAEDFKLVKKIDVHVHLNGNEKAFLKQAKTDNFRILTINTDYPEFIPYRKQQEIAVNLFKKNPGQVAFAGTFDIGKRYSNFQPAALLQIDNAISQGASAIKIWKNVGMSIKDSNGLYIMPDNSMFDAVYDHLVEKNIPLFIHVGEPKNCWLPVSQMTVNNDKIYFKNHPEYHMYLHPECPGYQQYIDSRDSILKKHPRLNVIGCHLGSLEWSVDELADRLEQYPNFSVDLAARIGQIQYQSLQDREKVRNFFIKYQDRILYGSDQNTTENMEANSVRRDLHDMWISDWKFLTTDGKMSSIYLDESFRGLNLPKKVIDKIYYRNAKRYFNKFD